jgi:hypothetical protein
MPRARHLLALSNAMLIERMKAAEHVLIISAYYDIAFLQTLFEPKGTLLNKNITMIFARPAPPAAETDPLFLGSREPSEHPLPDHGPFELGKDAHHLKHCPTGRPGGVETLLMQEEIDAFGVKLPQEIQ